jgi:dTDP-glucose 4,6-dehydratase
VANIERILVTGGAGFIGSSFIRTLLGANLGIQVVNVDKLTYAGNLVNLRSIERHPDYRFCLTDITEPQQIETAFQVCEDAFGGAVDAVVHFAAESHVDRSIEDPAVFFRTNVMGTQILLETARKAGVQRFIHISTDEVYGSLGPAGSFHEDMPLVPNSPYSASKASSDLIARAYYQTYGFPVTITRCSNNYGPYQFPEKLIPLMIANALEDKALPIYGDGLNIRDWIHVDDHSAAILAVLLAGRPGQVYNIGGQAERSNLEVVRTILRTLGKPEGLVRFVPDRPGHDRRYAMDTAKIRRELGWEPKWTFDEGIQTTIDWYVGNRDWVDCVRSGLYQHYYKRMYGDRESWLRSI